MKAEKIDFTSVGQAARTIDAIGSSNSLMMAKRSIHFNILFRQVPGDHSRTLKRAYNDIGGEVAISHDAYYAEKEVTTDMIVMGSVCQHQEVRRILGEDPVMEPYLDAISAVLNEAPETKE